MVELLLYRDCFFEEELAISRQRDGKVAVSFKPKRETVLARLYHHGRRDQDGPSVPAGILKVSRSALRSSYSSRTMAKTGVRERMGRKGWSFVASSPGKV